MEGITKVLVYRNRGVWCYAAYSGVEFDCSDTLDVFDNANETDALAQARKEFPDALDIDRVSDTHE